MVEEEKAKELERRIHEAELCLKEYRSKGISIGSNPLAEEIRRRKEMEKERKEEIKKKKEEERERIRETKAKMIEQRIMEDEKDDLEPHIRNKLVFAASQANDEPYEEYLMFKRKYEKNGTLPGLKRVTNPLAMEIRRRKVNEGIIWEKLNEEKRRSSLDLEIKGRIIIKAARAREDPYERYKALKKEYETKGTIDGEKPDVPKKKRYWSITLGKIFFALVVGYIASDIYQKFQKLAANQDYEVINEHFSSYVESIEEKHPELTRNMDVEKARNLLRILTDEDKDYTAKKPTIDKYLSENGDFGSYESIGRAFLYLAEIKKVKGGHKKDDVVNLYERGIDCLEKALRIKRTPLTDKKLDEAKRNFKEYKKFRKIK